MAAQWSCGRDQKLWAHEYSRQATGFALPVVLAHSQVIQPGACWMSIGGGVLVYGTILVYSGWFGVSNDDEF